MKNFLKHVSLFALAVGTGAALSWVFFKRCSSQREIALGARETVSVAYMALFSAKNRGVDELFDGLEGTLDHGLVYLWGNYSCLTQNEQDSVVELTRQVCTYRTEHPRPFFDGDVANIQKLADFVLQNYTNNVGEVVSRCLLAGEGVSTPKERGGVSPHAVTNATFPEVKSE